MKLRIEPIAEEEAEEIVIRCHRVDDRIQRLQRAILDATSGQQQLAFYKGTDAYYFPLDTVLFFETDGDHVYAHTAADAYRIKYRLYELEAILPACFLRVSKSAIVNVAQIYAVSRDLTAAVRIQFAGTHKQIYASRRYTPALQARLQERSHL